MKTGWRSNRIHLKIYYCST